MSKKIMFYSPIGGVGKTTLSSAFALNLSSIGYKTLLVDVSLFGNTDMLFRTSALQKGLNKLNSLYVNEENIDINNLIQEIKDFGIKNLEGIDNLSLMLPADPIKIDKLENYHIDALINAVEKIGFDYIIFDTSSDLTNRNIRLLEKCEKVYLLTNQDISSIWRLTTLKEILNNLYIDNSKIEVLLNRFRKDVRYNLYEAEKELGFKIVAKIPDFKGIIVDVFNATTKKKLQKKNILISKFKKPLENLLRGEIDEH